MAAEFFTTEVWTGRGLVTYYTVFVIEVRSRRVQIVGCTPHPDDAFMHRVVYLPSTSGCQRFDFDEVRSSIMQS